MTKQELLNGKMELGAPVEASEVFGRRYSKFASLVADLRAVNEMKREAESESKRINGLLQEMWSDVEAKTVMDKDVKVTLVTSKAADRIEPVKLLEAGVPLETIQKATVQGKGFQYVKVSVPD